MTNGRGERGRGPDADGTMSTLLTRSLYTRVTKVQVGRSFRSDPGSVVRRMVPFPTRTDVVFLGFSCRWSDSMSVQSQFDRTVDKNI